MLIWFHLVIPSFPAPIDDMRSRFSALSFDYGSVHICENSNKLGRVTSQSKVENKMAPYRTAAMTFTAIHDLEARRKAMEALKARRRKIRHLKQQQRMRQFLVKQALDLCFGHSLAYFVPYEFLVVHGV